MNTFLIISLLIALGLIIYFNFELRRSWKFLDYWKAKFDETKKHFDQAVIDYRKQILMIQNSFNEKINEMHTIVIQKTELENQVYTITRTNETVDKKIHSLENYVQELIDHRTELKLLIDNREKLIEVWKKEHASKDANISILKDSLECQARTVRKLKRNQKTKAKKRRNKK